VNETSGSGLPKEQIHKGWMAALLAAGVIVAGIAFTFARLFPGMDEADLPVWQSITTSFGVSLFSGGLLLIIEPIIRRQLKKAVERASNDIKSDLREEVKKDFKVEFDSIREEVRASLQSRADKQDAVVADFQATHSQASARAIMELLDDIGGLQDSKITVSGSEVPGELEVYLSLQYVGDESGYGEPPFTSIGEYSLCLGAATESGEAFTRWIPSETFAEAAKDLSGELESAGVLGSSQFQDYDWDAIAERLADHLQLALDSRRKTSGKIHLAGPLSEVIGINDPWYITANSLENPVHGFMRLASEFPARDVGMHGKGINFPAPFPRPESAEETEWEHVLSVAREKFSPLRLGGRG
jgi:hypothetical protein